MPKSYHFSGSDLSKVFGDSNFVLATSDQDSTWKIGDTVQIGDETLTIAGLLKNDPFSENGLTNGKLTLIISDETFVRLTGEEGYSLVLIQTTGDVTDENVQAIQNSVDQTYSFRDKRDERTTGTYMAFVFCVYAFLAIIALVTVMNIVNRMVVSDFQVPWNKLYRRKLLENLRYPENKAFEDSSYCKSFLPLPQYNKALS